MTRNCSVNPLGHTQNPVWQATNAVFLPVQLGVGIIGNIITIIILNSAHMRTSSSIYVYLTGLATLDLLTLLMTIPVYLRDMEILSLEDGFSKEMATYVTLYNGFGNIIKHSATWVVVFVAIVRYTVISRPFVRLRWTKISASRIIVFLIVVACVVIDFARFFEFEVVVMHGHCFPMLLWKYQYTEFSKGSLFVNVYPWAVSTLCFFIPFFLIMLFNLLIIIHMKLWNMTKKEIFATPKTSHDEIRTNIMLLIIIVVFFILELPDAIAHVLLGLGSVELRSSQGFRNFVLISNCLSLTHSCINFMLYTVLSADFRKTMKRAFCRPCLRDDEYYEPFTCCGLCPVKEESINTSRKSSSDTTITSNSKSHVTLSEHNNGDIWV